MDVFVSIRKLITEFLGAAFNLSRPPSTNVIDGSEGFFRSLVYRKGSGEIGRIHDATGSSCTNAAFWRSSALAAPLRQLSAMDADMGSGKISSSPLSSPSKMACATDSAEAFGTSKARDMSVSTGPGR